MARFTNAPQSRYSVRSRSNRRGVLRGTPHGPCSLAWPSHRCEVGATRASAGCWAQGLPREGRGSCSEALSFLQSQDLGVADFTYVCKRPFPLPGLSRSGSWGPQAPWSPVQRSPSGSPRSAPGSSPVVNTTPPGPWSGNPPEQDRGQSVHGPGAWLHCSSLAFWASVSPSVSP